MSKLIGFLGVLAILGFVGLITWGFSGILYDGGVHATTAQTATTGTAVGLVGLIFCVDCGRRKYYRSPNRVREYLPEYAWPNSEAKKMTPAPAAPRRKTDTKTMLSMLSVGRDQIAWYVSKRLGDDRKRRTGRFICKDGSGRVHIEMTARDGRPYRVRRQEHLVSVRKAIPDFMAA